VKTRLHRIEIRNFKAFKSFELDLDGKHLLVYGPNGSGKSSLYWALHCFLQSSRKPTQEVAKYFDPANPQNLLNIHEDPAANPGEIALTLRQMSSKTDTTYRLSLTTHGTQNIPIVKNSDLASDFITYRFFFGFSHFRNSEGFNIWPLFETEILPFCVSNDEKTPLQMWLEIRDGNPNPDRLKGYGAQNAHRYFRQRTNRFQTILDSITRRISTRAQEFYDEHFAHEDLSPIRFGLLLKTPLSPSRPEVVFELAVGSTRITRPQTYLNEAKMTQLALSVRFAASLVNLHTNDLKLLVLDDLLVSLDMSNRMKVIDILMSPTFKDYQKIILTHDRGLFEETRRAIGPLHSEWRFVDYKQKSGAFRPELVKSKLEVAEDYLNDDALDLCGNQLRKHAEDALVEFITKAKRGKSNKHLLDKGSFATLSSMIKEAQAIIEKQDSQDFTKLFRYAFSDDEMNGLLAPHGVNPDSIAAAQPSVKDAILKSMLEARADLSEAVCNALSSSARKRHNALELLAEIDRIRDRVLNPASHAGVTPIYRKEAEDALNVLRALEPTLKAALSALNQP
jgi:energy-coupling factor transporter ATP-binding protein EcfA2